MPSYRDLTNYIYNNIPEVGFEAPRNQATRGNAYRNVMQQTQTPVIPRTQKQLGAATNAIYERYAQQAGPSGALPGTYTPAALSNLQKGGYEYPTAVNKQSRDNVDKLMNALAGTPMSQQLLFNDQGTQLNQYGQQFFSQQNPLVPPTEKIMKMLGTLPEGANIGGIPGQMNSLDAIMAAIASNETGGYGDPYTVVNENDPSGAFGKYQILGDNIPSWTAEALGRTLTPQQFLNDPAAQDQTARYWMQKYLNQYGNPQSVAEAWNAGPGNVGKGVVPEYVNKFNEALGLAMAQSQNSPAGSNAWVSPIAGANIGDEQFGWRTHPVTGRDNYHGGIDLGARDNAVAGTSIYSATGGKIIEAGFNSAWGNTYVIADPTGKYHIRYAHMQDLMYGPGTEVTPGMVIGRVGSTGYSTGPHLHFEVTTPTGEYIDPRNLF